MNSYTVQDITNRLEEMCSDLSGLEKLQENTEEFSLSPYLLTDLQTYMAAQRGAWDYKTAALFDALETLLRKLETILA